MVFYNSPLLFTFHNHLSTLLILLSPPPLPLVSNTATSFLVFSLVHQPVLARTNKQHVTYQTDQANIGYGAVFKWLIRTTSFLFFIVHTHMVKSLMLLASCLRIQHPYGSKHLTSHLIIFQHSQSVRVGVALEVPSVQMRSERIDKEPEYQGSSTVFYGLHVFPSIL